MLQSPDGFGLVEEALPGHAQGLAFEFAAQCHGLHRHRPSDARVVGHVDGPHGPSAELVVQEIASQGGTAQVQGCGLGGLALQLAGSGLEQGVLRPQLSRVQGDSSRGSGVPLVLQLVRQALQRQSQRGIMPLYRLHVSSRPPKQMEDRDGEITGQDHHHRQRHGRPESVPGERDMRCREGGHREGDRRQGSGHGRPAGQPPPQQHEHQRRHAGRDGIGPPGAPDVVPAQHGDCHVRQGHHLGHGALHGRVDRLVDRRPHRRRHGADVDDLVPEGSCWQRTTEHLVKRHHERVAAAGRQRGIELRTKTPRPVRGDGRGPDRQLFWRGRQALRGHARTAVGRRGGQHHRRHDASVGVKDEVVGAHDFIAVCTHDVMPSSGGPLEHRGQGPAEILGRRNRAEVVGPGVARDHVGRCTGPRGFGCQHLGCQDHSLAARDGLGQLRVGVQCGCRAFELVVERGMVPEGQIRFGDARQAPDLVQAAGILRLPQRQRVHNHPGAALAELIDQAGLQVPRPRPSADPRQAGIVQRDDGHFRRRCAFGESLAGIVDPAVEP